MNSRCRKHLEDALKNAPSCYVLITCKEPSQEGEMEVHMTYEGDVTLASYLLQGAQSIIDRDEAEQVSMDEHHVGVRLVKDPGKNNFYF
jgi:hypothetical protein